MEIQMLKVKNVISILAKVTFFFYSLSIYSQRDIEGIFSVDYGIKDFVTRYHFFDNNIFYMESAGDLGLTEYGKGHYLVKNDSLILNFDLTELKENGYHKHKYYFNKNDSIQAVFKIQDFKNKPISNIMIWSNIDHAGKTSNKDGIATLKFKKQLQKKGKIEIQIEGEFYVKHIVYLDPELNYEIDVFLSESESYTNPQAIKYDIINYKIIEFNEAYIKFISIDGKITTWSKVD